MKTITVTVNPSLDRIMVVNYLNVGYHNQATGETHLAAAGRGMNIGLALHKLHTDTEAIVLLGQDALSHAYQFLIEQEGFPVNVVRHDSSIRSNIFLKDEGQHAETVIKVSGASVDEAALAEVGQMLVSRIDEHDFVVLAGSLPSGAPDSTYATYCRQAKEAGARVILYTEGDILREGLAAEPDLVVLTQLQTESYFNFPVRVAEEVYYVGEKLHEEGAQRVLILLGERRGAVLVTADARYLVEFPDDIDDVGTRTGTAEALVAGYLAGRSRQRNVEESLSMGGAAALFTAEQVGQEFGTLKDVQERIERIAITSVSTAFGE
ncbi:MAG: 1-phosphofructokinase family hexose kinase [Anaerolineales bacterium]